MYKKCAGSFIRTLIGVAVLYSTNALTFVVPRWIRRHLRLQVIVEDTRGIRKSPKEWVKGNKSTNLKPFWRNHQNQRLKTYTPCIEISDRVIALDKMSVAQLDLVSDNGVLASLIQVEF